MSSLQQARRQRGFSVIEILVGMAVGLVITLIIYQVISTYEGIKRSTTTSGDTQQNGIFSLSTIERDVRAAGWGVPTADILPCARYLTYISDGTTTGPVPNFPNGPLRIADGGTAPGASDSLTVLWGTSVRGNVRNPLLQNVAATSPGMPTYDLLPTTKVAVSGAGGFVWLTDDSNECALTRITGSVVNPANPDSVILSHATGSGSADQPAFNAPSDYMVAQGWPATFAGQPRIYDMGTLTQRTYSVVGSSLMSRDYFSSNTEVQVSNNVVALKAQYGVSDVGGQIVTNWVSATTTWAVPSAVDAKRIKAIRVAVVVRSPLKERLAPDATACTITTTPPATWPGGPAVDLSNDPDWRCYRYRTFETVVPLRNVIWANLT